MALTRIKTNQITDSAVTTAKIANNAITAGKLANNLTYGSDLTVSGNLTVSGTTTSVSTTNTRVEDAIIALSAEATGSASVDAGLLINRGDDDNQAFLWDESADQFVVANVGAEDGDTGGNVTISSYAGLQAGAIIYGSLNDGSTTLTSTVAELNILDGVTATAAELNALDGITATVSELNIMDGDTSVGTTAVAGTDGIVTNDAGTMKQTSVDTFDTYLAATTKTLTNKTIDSANNTLTLDLSEGTLTGTTAEFNTALSDGSFATLAGTETLSNKTLTAPKIANAGFIADANGNELIIFTTTASAVNEITYANAAASGHPTITTTGSDTNINLVLSPKGSGTIDVSTSKIVNVTDPTSAQDAATKAYVDSQVSSGSSLSIAGDSGTDTVTVGSDTFTFSGTANEITTAVTDNTVTISLPDDVTIGSDLTVTGNLTVNGTTTTISTTNSVVSDNLIELNNGAASNANDSGIVIERGSTGDNAFMGWDESADGFIVGTTTATGTGTGDLTITAGAFQAGAITMDSASVGGGYGSTGVSISSAGVIQANGAITTDGTLTAADAAIGGGYGSTGVTISGAGVIQANGAITSDGAVTGGSLTDGTATFSSGALSGATTGAFSSNLTVNGNIDISGGSGTITTNVGDTLMLYSVSGVITGEAGFTYNQSTNELTIPSATVSDLTSGRIVFASTSGALADAGTLLWDGTDLTAGSAKISDLTSGRVVLAGTSGAIEDSGNLTFNGSTLAVTGAITASSNVDIADAGSLRVGTGNDFTINHDGTNTTITNGTGILAINGLATSSIRINEAGANVDTIIEGDTNTSLVVVDASGDNVGIGGAPNANAVFHVNDTGAMILPAGTTAQRPTAVTGMFRYNTTSNSIEYYDNDSWESVSASFTVATSQTFNGDDTTTAFTLSALTGADSYTVAGVLVMLNGIVQEPTTVYGISGTTLTFTTAPATGDLIEVRKFTTTTTVTALSDLDGDTLVQVEESSDEDTIRFDAAGTEIANIAAGGLTLNGQADLRFADLDSSNWVAFQAPATVASNVTWTLPSADAGVSGYALVSDGAGTLSFAAAGATVSSDTSTNSNFLLYFASTTTGALTGVKQDSGLTYNPSTGLLTSAAFAGALTGNVTGDVTGNADTATTATNVTTTDNTATNETVYIAFVDGTSGAQGIEVDSTGLTYNPSTNTLTTSVFSGTATAAQYADLAEMYAADSDIEPGTVVMFAGEGKLAACDTANCRAVAGIVSTDPAHLMNSTQEGVALALAGRVPCKVTGPVAAGDLMVSAGNGMAMANNEAALGTVIGKAIEANEDGEGVIEVLALMM